MSGIVDGLEPLNLSELDFSSYAMNIASQIQRDMEESNRRARQIGEEAYNNRQRMQTAIEQTAINTGETNNQLQKIVENQNAYIDMLKEQLSMQKMQLQVDEQQLGILKNIFASGEDSVAVEKEIMKLILDQIDSRHPLWDYVKDKGGDIAVDGIIKVLPIIYTAIKTYLISKGINLS